MKKLFKIFTRKQPPAIDRCTNFEVNKEDASTFFGGFKEYKPPIYEHDNTGDRSFKTTDLLTDINHN